MRYHIEHWQDGSWVRRCTVSSYSVALNMKKVLAEQAGEDINNYSILVEVTACI